MASNKRTAEPAASAPDGSDAETEAERKERVLHTRIPAVLESELKALARGLRVPVSNLVRTILEDAIAVADRATGEVEDRLNRLAATVHHERARVRSWPGRQGPPADVVAYQPVVVAQETRCASCATPLERGAKASLGITRSGGVPLFFCTRCADEASADDRR